MHSFVSVYQWSRLVVWKLVYASNLLSFAYTKPDLLTSAIVNRNTYWKNHLFLFYITDIVLSIFYFTVVLRCLSLDFKTFSSELLTKIVPRGSTSPVSYCIFNGDVGHAEKLMPILKHRNWSRFRKHVVRTGNCRGQTDSKDAEKSVPL